MPPANNMSGTDTRSIARPADAPGETRPRVTVVMIFLNMSTFLAEAIDSVLTQQYTHWELMLVDDGSSDGSTEIARRYADRYPGRVHYLEHPGHENRGMSASRNLGVHAGCGEYVAFLDSDDVWLPNKLVEHVALLDAHPEAGWLAGGLIMWYSWTHREQDLASDRTRELRIERDRVLHPPHHFCEFLRNGGALPGINSLLIRRSAIESVGGSDDRFRGAYEDQVLISKLSLNFPVYIASGCLDRYRQHPGSHTAMVRRDGAYHPYRPHQLRRPFLEWVESYVRERGIENADVLEAVRVQLSPYRSRAVFALWWVRQSVAGLRWTVRAALEDGARRVGRDLVPTGLHAWASRRVYGENYRPPKGLIDFGSLRRVTPVSRCGGRDRGLPVDRYYIEQLLARHAGDIRGHVLEIGDDAYARRFGGDRVGQIDILHAYAGNPKATIVADLADAPHIPDETFDCIILTQTLQYVFDARAAVRTLHRSLTPGGVLLATVPGISQIVPDVAADDAHAHPWWSFTSHSMARMLRECFSAEHVSVQSFGNVLAATALLHGACAEELTAAELDAVDGEYQVIVGVRAVK